MPSEMSTTNQTSQTDAGGTGKLVAWIRAEIRRSFRRCHIDQTLLQCWAREDCCKRTVLHDAWWRSSWQIGWIMSRVHLASKWSIISSERMDPWKHEDRSSFGCDGLISSRTLRCSDHDRIPIWWQHLFLGSDCEWNQQIRDRNVRRDSRCKFLREECRETCCESQTTTDIKFDVVSCVCSIPWTQVDRHGTRKIRQKFSGGVEIDDQIATTWRFNTSRRRRSSKSRRLGINISIEKWVCLAQVNSDMDNRLAKRRRRSKEKVSVLLEPWLIRTFSFPSNTSRPFWRRPCWSNIARQRTIARWLHRAHLSRWELTTHAPSTRLRWFREVKVSGTGTQEVVLRSRQSDAQARSTGKPAAKISRRLEAVTSTLEYKVHHTQPFKRLTMFAEKRSKKLIHQFETHPNRESLMADLNKNPKFNLFSEESKELIRSMGNAEYFHFSDTMPRLFTMLGNCMCGKCLQPSERNRQLNKERYNVLSIPNCVIKKNPSHGARHGPTERQWIHSKDHNTLRKSTLRKGPKKKCHTILERFWSDSLYRDSLTELGWDENIRRDRKRGALLQRDEREKKPRRKTRGDSFFRIREVTSKKQSRLATAFQGVCSNCWVRTHNKTSTTPSPTTAHSKGTNRIRIDLIHQLGGNFMFRDDELFSFFVILVANVRQQVGSMELGSFSMEGTVIVSRCRREIFACRKSNFPAVDGRC